MLPSPTVPTSTVTLADASVIASKYTAGFSQCALEVARCLGSIEGVQPEVRVHLTEHLAGCVQKLAKLANSVVPPSSTTSSSSPTVPAASLSSSPSPHVPSEVADSCKHTDFALNVTQLQQLTSHLSAAIPVTSSISLYPTQFVGSPPPAALVMVTAAAPVAASLHPQVGVVRPYQQSTAAIVCSTDSQPSLLLKPHAILPPSAGMVQLVAQDVWRPWH